MPIFEKLRQRRKAKKECAGPSCPSKQSKLRTGRKPHGSSKKKRPGKPTYNKPPSGPGLKPKATSKVVQYSRTSRGVTPRGSMTLPGSGPLTTEQLKKTRAAAGTVIKKDGKVFYPPARTK